MGWIKSQLWNFFRLAPFMAIFLLIVTAVGYTAPLWARLATWVFSKTGGGTQQ